MHRSCVTRRAPNNEASHRLGARDGINLVARFRIVVVGADWIIDEDHDEPTAFHPDVRSAATASRQEALGGSRQPASRDAAER